MRTKDWKRKPSPITKAKLATEVARKVDRFLKVNACLVAHVLVNDSELTCGDQDMNRNRTPSSDPVDFDRLSLVALEHGSLVSWQPHLRLI